VAMFRTGPKILTNTKHVSQSSVQMFSTQSEYSNSPRFDLECCK